MTRRTRARQICLQMLYLVDVNPDVGGRAVRAMIREQLPDDKLQKFAWQLFAGVMEFRPQLDEQIEAVAENWSLARMAPTDRNVLRLGAFELQHSDTPLRVVIDEAVDLARKFGAENSGQFVNGLLDRMIPEEKRALDRQARHGEEED